MRLNFFLCKSSSSEYGDIFQQKCVQYIADVQQNTRRWSAATAPRSAQSTVSSARSRTGQLVRSRVSKVCCCSIVVQVAHHYASFHLEKQSISAFSDDARFVYARLEAGLQNSCQLFFETVLYTSVCRPSWLLNDSDVNLQLE